MTEYAIPGEPHTNLPVGIERWNVDIRYGVVPWRCPACDQVIAQTIVQPRTPQVRTVMLAFSPVRDASADEGGIPFFGPSRRAMRGKDERRRTARLAGESFARARASLEYRSGPILPPRDHEPIELMEFDAVCDNCPRRLRFSIPPL
jgi:hypothetical protein